MTLPRWLPPAFFALALAAAAWRARARTTASASASLSWAMRRFSRARARNSAILESVCSAVAASRSSVSDTTRRRLDASWSLVSVMDSMRSALWGMRLLLAGKNPC